MPVHSINVPSSGCGTIGSFSERATSAGIVRAAKQLLLVHRQRLLQVREANPTLVGRCKFETYWQPQEEAVQLYDVPVGSDEFKRVRGICTSSCSGFICEDRFLILHHSPFILL